MAMLDLKKTLVKILQVVEPLKSISRLVILQTPIGNYNRGKITMTTTSYGHYVGLIITRYGVYGFDIYYGNTSSDPVIKAGVTKLHSYNSETLTASVSGNTAYFKSTLGWNEFNVIGFSNVPKSLSITADLV